MKTSAKKAEKCQVKLTITLEAEEAKAIVKQVEKVFMREAQIPGFRKGKVPIELIRKEFSSGLKQECEQLMIRQHYGDAVKAEKLDEVALAGIEEMHCDTEGGGFTAIVEVKPVFKLPTYKGLKVSEKSTEVKDEEVNEQVEHMRAAFAKYEDAKEGDSVAEGDFVQIDYSGTVGGKPITEINAEAKFVAEGKGFWVQAEKGRFLPEIIDAVKGMKVGEEKTKVKAKFDKESAPEGLGGAKAEYTVKVVGLRLRKLPNDAELAERAKAESFEKLVADTRERMEKSAVEDEARRRENEAITLLMKKVDFDVPESQVRRAAEGVLSDFAQRAQYSGLDAKYFEEHREEIMKNAIETGEKQVRFMYVLEAIAKEEKFDCKKEEVGRKVMDLILANAKK